MPKKVLSPGAALVAKRWAKTTPEQRSKMGRDMVAKRKKNNGGRPSACGKCGTCDNCKLRLKRLENKLK